MFYFVLLIIARNWQKKHTRYKVKNRSSIDILIQSSIDILIRSSIDILIQSSIDILVRSSIDIVFRSPTESGTNSEHHHRAHHTISQDVTKNTPKKQKSENDEERAVTPAPLHKFPFLDGWKQSSEQQYTEVRRNDDEPGVQFPCLSKMEMKEFMRCPLHSAQRTLKTRHPKQWTLQRPRTTVWIAKSQGKRHSHDENGKQCLGFRC